MMMQKLINFSFYSTPDELFEYAKGLISRYSLYGYLIIGNELDIEIEPLSSNSRSADSIVFSCTELELAKSINDLEIKNPNSMFLEIGKFSKSELRESWLFTLKILESSAAMTMWQKALRELKKNLQPGAWICYEKLHTRKFDKRIRYSNGVHLHYLNGGKVMPAYGDNIYLEFENVVSSH